jgi:hypothetical protein
VQYDLTNFLSYTGTVAVVVVVATRSYKLR